MSDPIDAIEEMLRQRGWQRRHLYPALGSTGKASEVMNRVRPLSLPMIRCLVINYGMDAATMIKWYPTKMQPVEPINMLMKVFRDVAEEAA
jgi:HTH-type transcriptional regulator / antitoxin HigA